MNITLYYKDRPAVLPTLSSNEIAGMDGAQAKLLLLLAHDATLSADTLADTLGLTAKELAKALGALAELGLIAVENEENGVAKPEKIRKPISANKQKTAIPEKRSRIVEVPVYTDGEFEAVLQKRRDIAALITEAQNALGKPIYQEESKLLASIAEAYEFDEEYMLILLAYCRRIDKRNMRYVEKIATSLYDLGIKSPDELTEYLRIRENSYRFEKNVRSIFGLGSRAFTTKEKAFLTAWNETYRFDEDMIRKAYDITISATSKPTLHYANSILERWYAEGIKTPADLETASAAPKKKAGTSAVSFDADDFFRAALDRSYSDKPDKKE